MKLWNKLNSWINHQSEKWEIIPRASNQLVVWQAICCNRKHSLTMSNHLTYACTAYGWNLYLHAFSWEINILDNIKHAAINKPECQMKVGIRDVQFLWRKNEPQPDSDHEKNTTKRWMKVIERRFIKKIIQEQAWDIFVYFKSVYQETRMKEDTEGYCVFSRGSGRPPHYAPIRHSYCKLSLIFIWLDWVGRVLLDYIQGVSNCFEG